MHHKLLDLILNHNQLKQSINLNGEHSLTLPEIISVALSSPTVKLQPSIEVTQRHQAVLKHIKDQISNGVPIYGVSASYGARASLVINQGDKDKKWHDAQKLTEAIAHVDVSTGEPLPATITRAAMLIRLNMLMPGYSGVSLETLQCLADLINSGITPIVGRYGTLGASGDLAQNGRVLSVLRQLDSVNVWDKSGHEVPAKQALSEIGLKPLSLEPKEGLGMVNGDNFSTAAATMIAYELANLWLLNTGIMALSIQVLKGSTRDFHPLLTRIRPHPGQIFTASILRQLLEKSQLAHQELAGHEERQPGESVQDVYSIRCLPQYFGPDIERFDLTIESLVRNANAVSDNPLWTTPETITEGEAPYQWVSGGNFLAMHMSEALDSMRKLAVHMVKQNDRHLNRMINRNLNNGLPANLSDETALSQCTFKGLQTQMGMFEVYASILAAPVNTAFGIHEELNQDLTSHALTSAIMTWEVIKLVRRAMATNLIAACQGVDLRGGPDLLSPTTEPLYHWLRHRVPYIKSEQPLGHYVEAIAADLLESNQAYELAQRLTSEN